MLFRSLPPFVEEEKKNVGAQPEESTTIIEQVEETPQDIATLDEPVIDTIVCGFLLCLN
mgnify:CR=1 FL=1